MKIYIIKHPGKDEYVVDTSYLRIMDNWFEGYNVPFEMNIDISESKIISRGEIREYFEKKEKKWQR